MATDKVHEHFSNLAEEGVWASLYTPGKVDSETWSFLIRARRVSELLQSSGTTLREVVDIGCGTAPIARSVVASGAHYTGLDFSAEMVESARQNIKDLVESGKANLGVSDFTSVQFPDQKADALIAMGVLEYLTRPTVDQALRETRRILRPGGVAILTIPKRHHWGMLVSRLFEPIARFVRPGGSKLKLNQVEQFERLYLTPQELDAACQRAGLRKVDARHYNMQPIPRLVAARAPRASYLINRPFEPMASSPLSYLATGYIGMYRRDA